MPGTMKDVSAALATEVCNMIGLNDDGDALTTLFKYVSHGTVVAANKLSPEMDAVYGNLMILMGRLYMAVRDYPGKLKLIDAIDTVGAKLLLAQRCYEAGTPLISSMGTGNKLDSCSFEVADISKTSVCPLARVMRRELKKRGIPSLKVVYSKEIPVTHKQEAGDASHRPVPGSMSFVPPVAGMILAGEVIKSIARTEE